MTVFKTFLKILNKNKGVVLLYTAILVFFGFFATRSGDINLNFEEAKPSIYIDNQDELRGITKGLVDFLEKSTNKVELDPSSDAIKDALFYRDISIIIHIPKNYHIDFLEGKNPEIKMESTKNYQASLAELLLEKYMKTAHIYLASKKSESEIIRLTEETLNYDITTEITSKIDSSKTAKATLFFNFANYSLLAGCIYIICLMISSFKEQKIKNRTVISSMNYRKFNRILLLSNALFAFFLWFLYILISFIMVGSIMLTKSGLLYMINSFVFTFCALTIAFFLGNIIRNKNTIDGIINVIALGSSFLCGAFVPAEMLPNFVLNIAHILPSYYFINSNEFLKTLDTFSLQCLQPYLINLFILIIFSIMFIILTNYVSKRKARQ